jgi:hypothetical protein
VRKCRANDVKSISRANRVCIVRRVTILCGVTSWLDDDKLWNTFGITVWVT